jgi:hypothetical protein
MVRRQSSGCDRSCSGGNWLCFAPSPPPGHAVPPDIPSCPSLALFCTIRPPHTLGLPGIGFVLHASAPRRLGVPARHLPPLAGIGFVLHIYPPAGRNWVRFAQSLSGGAKLGLFCTIGTGLERWNDRIVESWVFRRPAGSPKLGLFCIIIPRLPAGLPNWLCSYECPDLKVSENPQITQILAD